MNNKKIINIVVILIITGIILFSGKGNGESLSQTIGQEMSAVLGEEIKDLKTNAGASLTEAKEADTAIKKIHCSNPTQEDIDKIGKMTGLKELKLDIGDLSPDLSVLSNLYQLEKLYISGGELNFDFLKTLNHLIEVDISGHGMEDLSCFQYMKELERLSVSYVEIVDFKYIENLSKLLES